MISLFLCTAILLNFSCNRKVKPNYTASISSLDLKRGDIVSCGPEDGQLYGSVSFSASVPDSLRQDFNIAVALLHSFEYDESEKMFAKIIDHAPGCAMAYWGVAMCNFHALWAPPSEAEIQKGAKAIEIARSINNKTKRESEYIEAIAKFYEHADKMDNRSRVLKFENAMENIYHNYPGDLEAAVFYTLALDAAADPKDKTYANQRKAFAILSPIFEKDPLHPGIAHYIIHNCDYPELAELALPAARKYASIAPSSAHAQHMPSHIFTRLGLWDECIQSNLVSISSAKCYAEKAKLNGHSDEELHAMDYLVYAYLQKGNDEASKEQLDYLQTITEVSPVDFKTAYAFAAIPARYFLEKKMWKEASMLTIHPDNFPWEKFSWQHAIISFARLLGSVHTNNLAEANAELNNLNSFYNILSKQRDKSQEAAQVMVQIKTGEAWIAFKKGDVNKGLALMSSAADMEDGMEKHPVTPGEVIPARELFADMLMESNKPLLSLANFELDLKRHPNRFNGLYGAGLAAQNSGNKEKEAEYYKKLLAIADPLSKRKELQKVRSFLNVSLPSALR